MYAPVKRKGAGRPSSRGALVDVEVDRCTDENSASNLKYRLSFDKASSTKTEDPSINQISDSSQIASRNPNFFLTVTREAPTTDRKVDNPPEKWLSRRVWMRERGLAWRLAAPSRIPLTASPVPAPPPGQSNEHPRSHLYLASSLFTIADSEV
jgi:hypothetical protein